MNGGGREKDDHVVSNTQCSGKTSKEGTRQRTAVIDGDYQIIISYVRVIYIKQVVVALNDSFFYVFSKRNGRGSARLFRAFSFFPSARICGRAEGMCRTTVNNNSNNSKGRKIEIDRRREQRVPAETNIATWRIQVIHESKIEDKIYKFCSVCAETAIRPCYEWCRYIYMVSVIRMRNKKIARLIEITVLLTKQISIESAI